MTGHVSDTAPGRATVAGKRFSSRVLGCKVNQVEGEQVVAGLLDYGFEAVPEESADVIVVGTCTVTGEADAKARKAIRHALSLPARPTVVVTGCLAVLARAELEALGERVLVEPEVSRVAERVAAVSGGATTPLADTRRCNGTRPRIGSGFHTRAMVKVQDGCDAFCSYCIVPYARGNPRSVRPDDVVSECRALVEAGVREIVLAGINLGRYEHSNIRLSQLVSLLGATGIERLRLSSIEPLDLTEELVGVLASTPSVCEHLHVPLQSGSDAVLREMGRVYTTAEYAARISRARAALPGLAVSTDVLAGFPGESDEDAAETEAFCRAMRFSRLHVFRYSPRRGTPAAGRSDQVPAAVRAERAARLRGLDQELRAAHARAARGRVREVLVERVECDASTAPGFAEGVTRDYLRVRVPMGAPSATVKTGSLVTARIGQMAEDGTVLGVVEVGTSPLVEGPEAPRPRVGAERSDRR